MNVLEASYLGLSRGIYEKTSVFDVEVRGRHNKTRKMEINEQKNAQCMTEAIYTATVASARKSVTALAAHLTWTIYI